MTNQKGDQKTDFDGANKLEQIKMIEDVIKKLGFDKIGDGKNVDRETFGKNIETVKSECQLFVNVNKSQPMFGYDKAKINKILNSKAKNKIKQFMVFINSLLSEWFVAVEIIRKSKKINDKVVTVISYCINYIDNIQEYI